MSFKEKVVDLTSKTEELEEKKEKFKNNKIIFEQENEELLKEIKDLDILVKSKKEDLTVDAKELFKINKDKKQYGGIGIRQTDVIKYDQKRAFEWAKEEKKCLQLDTKSFEAVAIALDLDFIEKDKETTVTFPKVFKLY